MYEKQTGTNARQIADSFERPHWYLTAYAANITIRVETVAAMLIGTKADRILDIGCGDGSLSLPLTSDARHITFLDQSRAMLDIAKTRLPQRDGLDTRYVNSDFQEASFDEETFDLVICVGVLAYIDDLTPFIEKLARLLRSGGQLVLECTDEQHFLSAIDRSYKRVVGLFRRRRFSTYDHSALDVVSISTANGLALQTTFRYAYHLPLVSRFISQRLLYGLIRKIYGRVEEKQRAKFGNQCIFCFTKQ